MADGMTIRTAQGTFDHGSNRDVDTEAEVLTSTVFDCAQGVLIKAALSNTGTVYVGNSDVTAGSAAATDGFPLSAGASLALEFIRPDQIYVIASTANQVVYWLGI